jgi:hypothetical protein
LRTIDHPAVGLRATRRTFRLEAVNGMTRLSYRIVYTSIIRGEAAKRMLGAATLSGKFLAAVEAVNGEGY